MTHIPASEPAQLTAGDTWQWYRSAPSGYGPGDGFALSYTIVPETVGSAAYTFAATDNGDGRYLVTVAAAVTATYLADRYQWQAYATHNDGRRKTFERGYLTVLADLAGDTVAADTRTHARRVLDAIEAVIEGRASATDLSYSIEGRSLSRIPHAELLALRSQYQREVDREERAARLAQGLGGGSRVLVRMP